MDLGLKGKVAIITGGSRGIGRAIALGLAAEGCNVAICARGEEQLRATEAELKATGVRVHADSVDVAQAGSVEAFVDEVAKALGRVDVLVNNAGGARQGDDDDAWQGALDLNLMAAVRASRAAVAHMRKNGGGSIVNITSIGGINAGPGLMSYRAAKAAVVHLTRSTAIDLAEHGVRVNCVAPAHIATAINTTYDQSAIVRLTQPLQRLGQPSDIAGAVAFLASDRAAQITGIVMPVDGGTTAGPPPIDVKKVMARRAEEAT
jgi:3-oxoacyl-[acyl-carrier protein] reductase